jgi:6-phosphogluconolactonase
VAAAIATRVREAVSVRGRATLAVSGGSTPLHMFDELARSPLPWSRVHLFQVDERVAPDPDPARNLLGLHERLVDRVSLPADNLHAIPVASSDPDAAAVAYAHTLAAVAGTPPVLDVVQLGAGADGHTASLVPGDPVLDVTDRDVAATGVYAGHRRVTVTYPLLARARQLIWMIAGHEKADVVARLQGSDRSIPAGRVATGRSLVIVDGAAAGRL